MDAVSAGKVQLALNPILLWIEQVVATEKQPQARLEGDAGAQSKWALPRWAEAEHGRHDWQRVKK